MKIFIGSSSSDEISMEYKIVSKYLVSEISKDNDLVFGCANRGLMGVCYKEFLKNNRDIIGVCYSMYKDDLNGLKLSEVIEVDNLDCSTRNLEKKSDLILFLPGSFGTLNELVYILESKRTGLHNKDIVIFNINGFYDDLLSMLDKINTKISNKYDYKKLCKVFNKADDIIRYIKEKNE